MEFLNSLYAYFACSFKGGTFGAFSDLLPYFIPHDPGHDIPTNSKTMNEIKVNLHKNTVFRSFSIIICGHTRDTSVTELKEISILWFQANIVKMHNRVTVESKDFSLSNFPPLNGFVHLNCHGSFLASIEQVRREVLVRNHFANLSSAKKTCKR